MGKLNIKICDACGAVPESMAEVDAKNKFWPRTYTPRSYNYGTNVTSADLCSDCAKKFREFMSGAKTAQAKVSKALEKCGYTKATTKPAAKKKK